MEERRAARDLAAGDARLPWIEGDRIHAQRLAPTPKRRHPLFGLFIILGLGFLVATSFLVGRNLGSYRTPHVISVLPPSRPAVPPPDFLKPAPRSQAATTSDVAPALSRLRQKGGASTGILPGEVAPALAQAERAAEAPHPIASQVREMQRVVHLERDRAKRERARVVASTNAQRTLPTYAPRLAPPGRVVQLGAYASVDEAESAAQVFRYRYRGLLAQVPKAVTPYRPAGSPKMYYRVQFIAPSQAYAEVTCQRLRAAGKSCIVIY